MEAIDAPSQAKAGGHCAIVTQVDGEMKVWFVCPCSDNLSLCPGIKLLLTALGWNSMTKLILWSHMISLVITF